MATAHPLDGTEPSSSAGGRPPALKPEHIAILRDIVMERAQASLADIADTRDVPPPPLQAVCKAFRTGLTPVCSSRCKSGCANHGGDVGGAQVRQARRS